MLQRIQHWWNGKRGMTDRRDWITILEDKHWKGVHAHNHLRLLRRGLAYSCQKQLKYSHAFLLGRKTNSIYHNFLPDVKLRGQTNTGGNDVKRLLACMQPADIEFLRRKKAPVTIGLTTSPTILPQDFCKLTNKAGWGLCFRSIPNTRP